MADQKISARTLYVGNLAGTELFPGLVGVAEFKFTGQQIADIVIPDTTDNYASDAAAAAGGIGIGELYHTAGTVKIRLT